VSATAAAAASPRGAAALVDVQEHARRGRVNRGEAIAFARGGRGRRCRLENLIHINGQCPVVATGQCGNEKRDQARGVPVAACREGTRARGLKRQCHNNNMDEGTWQSSAQTLKKEKGRHESAKRQKAGGNAQLEQDFVVRRRRRGQQCVERPRLLGGLTAVQRLAEVGETGAGEDRMALGRDEGARTWGAGHKVAQRKVNTQVRVKETRQRFRQCVIRENINQDVIDARACANMRI
jgi:hypothetical protein